MRAPALVLAMLLCIRPAAARAGDAQEIGAAMYSFYYGNIFTSMHWTQVVINVDGDDALFYAENGEVAVDSLLERRHGAWAVTQPSKGLVVPSLLMSFGIPARTAYFLLHQCNRNVHGSLLRLGAPPDDASFRPPYTFTARYQGRPTLVRVERVHVAAGIVRTTGAYRRTARFARMTPFDAILCTGDQGGAVPVAQMRPNRIAP